MNRFRHFDLTVLSTVFAAALIFSVCTQAAAQEPQPARTPPLAPPPALVVESDDEITIDTELVNLNVRVVDRYNRPIANLSRTDFTVFEDKTAQPIEFFSTSEVPTNYTLLIDNSGSLRAQLEKVIDAGKTIIGTNRPADETSIIRFVSSEKIMLEQDFTSDKEELMHALDNLFVEGGQTALIDAVYVATNTISDYEKIRGDVKRRALILVSDGEDRNSVYEEEQLFALLRETSVQIYVIGFVDELDSDGSIIRKSPQKKAKALLTRLAEETGGKVYFPKNVEQLGGIAIDIASELRTQYSIGYMPTNDRKDGTYRNIRVEVNDGPGKQKRIPITRTGRTAEKEPTLRPVDDKSRPLN